MKYTILSIFIVSVLVAQSVYAESNTAELRIVPSDQTEDVFTADVRLDTGGYAIGGVEVYVQYSENLTLIGSESKGSVMDQEVIPVQEKDGVVEFVRMRFDEGFNGDDGFLATLSFSINSEEETYLKIDEQRSQVISLDDPKNVLGLGNEVEVTTESDFVEMEEENVQNARLDIAPVPEETQDVISDDTLSTTADIPAKAVSIQSVVVLSVLGLGVLLFVALMIIRRKRKPAENC